MEQEKNVFTCVGRGHGAPVLPATAETWLEMRRERGLAELCARIERMVAEGADEEAVKREKSRLPVWTPHCAEFKNNHRAAADALRPLPRLMLDFDQKGHTAEIMARLVNLTTPSPLKVLLIEESVRHGTHVLVELPQGMTAEAAQRLMAEATGFEPDRAVKDVARCIYMVPEGYTRFVSEGLWETRGGLDSPPVDSPPVDSPPTDSPPALPKGREQIPSSVEREAAIKSDRSLPLGRAGGESPLLFRGIPSSRIIAEFFRRTGGEPAEGERNVRLYQLAANLRAICDNRREVLMQVMPRYGLAEAEVHAIVDSATKEPPKGVSRVMQEVVRGLTPEPSPVGEGRGGGQAETSSPPQGGAGGGLSLPPMPRRLPPLVRLLVSRTPELYRAAVAHAVFPPLGAHLCGVRFRYLDNVAHEATLMNVLMAPTGAGKDCISAPINRIMADIRLRDEENLQRERQWKNEVNSRGANKDKRLRPTGLVIQEIDADMTNPAFVMRTAEAEGHFLYTKLNEIDQFDALRGNGRGGQQFRIMCLAFDPDNRYGQTRVGAQSVTEKVCIRFNWNAATTVQKGQRYFRDVLTDGPVSRINFCTIPEREIGAEMPVYGTYDADFDRQLAPYIQRLVAARGEVDCPQALRLARRLVGECADVARLSQSRVYENLSFRANVIAYLKACLLYVAHGQRWSRDIEEFVRWSLHYDLACKMQFFGDEMARAMEAPALAADRRRPGPRNLLELLPDAFTDADAAAVRRRQGLAPEGTRKMLNTWVARGYIRCTDAPETDDTVTQLHNYKKQPWK